jgi:PHD/YefM family antitoxin component YafN of YafNO toxin-antitoxin module
MTDLELIKDFGRSTVSLNGWVASMIREAAHLSGQERKAWSYSPHDKLLEAPGQAIAYYKFTEALTRQMPIDLALDAWRDTQQRLQEMRAEWDGMESPGSDFNRLNDIIEYQRELLANLVAKAEAECRAHEETLHLLSSPANAERLTKAIAEADAGLAKEMTLEELRSAGGQN